MSTTKIFILSFLIFALIGCASSVYKAELPPGSSQHTDSKGLRIFVSNSYVCDTACATYVNNLPVIYINPDFLKKYPKEIQWLIFYHELGHLRLKHHFLPLDEKDKNITETEAWLFAIEYLYRYHSYREAEFEIIYPYFKHVPKKVRENIIKAREEKGYEAIHFVWSYSLFLKYKNP